MIEVYWENEGAGRMHVGGWGGMEEREPNFIFYCGKLIDNS